MNLYSISEIPTLFHIFINVRNDEDEQIRVNQHSKSESIGLHDEIFMMYLLSKDR